MRTRQFTQSLIAGSVLAMLPVLPVIAAPTLPIVPQGPTQFNVGAPGAQVTFDIQIQGLVTDEVLSFYDFGIISDPAVITLASATGFTNLLGNPAASDAFGPTEVYNQNHLDQTNDPFAPVPVTNADCGATGYFFTCNSQWDYTQADVDLGAYVGPVLGTPIVTAAGDVNQGSLRFYQSSYLDAASLQGLQNPTGGTFTLFSLTFDVITALPASTPVVFVDDRNYANYDPINGPWVMDVKLNDPFDPRYLERTGSQVVVGQVPLPATWALLAIGALGAGAARRLRRGDRAKA